MNSYASLPLAKISWTHKNLWASDDEQAANHSPTILPPAATTADKGAITASHNTPFAQRRWKQGEFVSSILSLYQEPGSIIH
jgi:hypothetical protein